MADLSMLLDIEVVIILNGIKNHPSILNDDLDLKRRFPDAVRVNRNYAELKRRKLPGTIEVWETMILIKGINGQILWKDDLAEE